MKLNLKNITTATAIIAIMMVAPACDKVDFGSMNDNPNLTPFPSTAALLSNSLSTLGRYTAGVAGNSPSTLGGIYAQYYAETQYTDVSRYFSPLVDWDTYYAGELIDLQTIIDLNTDPATAPFTLPNGSNANQIAVARIMKAYYFWVLTDTWGDLPYFEALKEKSTIPYDTQEAIYTDLLKELKEGVAGFDNGLAPKGDLLFGGNINKWKKFGNSVRMLVALRLSKVNANLGKSEFVAALGDGSMVISTLADNAMLVYPGGNYNNPFYQYYNVTRRDDYAVGEPLMDFMNNSNDLRNTVFGTSTVGFPIGLERDDAVAFATANTGYARLMNTSVAGATSPIPVVTAAHVWLARAEAAHLGWTSESVDASYEKGIELSWAEWGINNSAVLSGYLTNADVDLAGGDVLEKIATQQWIAWYPNGLQGWSVWRKTGYPDLEPAPDMNEIPRRVDYGPNEPRLNAENYANAAQRYKVGTADNSQFARMWWDMP
jgi:hypothetical protein